MIKVDHGFFIFGALNEKEASEINVQKCEWEGKNFEVAGFESCLTDWEAIQRRKEIELTTEHEGGWIKLHRKTLDPAVFADANLLKTWICCLLLANFKTGWFKAEGIVQPIQVDSGRFVTGRFSFHRTMYPRKTTNTPDPRTVWRWLKTLERMGNISVESSRQYSLITIANWELYQGAGNGLAEDGLEDAPEKAKFLCEEMSNPKSVNIVPASGLNQAAQKEMPSTMSNRCPTDVQLMSTIEESKESKKGKNNGRGDPAVKEVISLFCELHERKVGKPYYVSWGKDGKIVKDLLGTYPVNELNEMVRSFFDLEDPFVQNAGYSIGIFKTQVPKLLTRKPQDSLQNWEPKGESR